MPRKPEAPHDRATDGTDRHRSNIPPRGCEIGAALEPFFHGDRVIMDLITTTTHNDISVVTAAMDSSSRSTQWDGGPMGRPSTKKKTEKKESSVMLVWIGLLDKGIAMHLIPLISLVSLC